MLIFSPAVFKFHNTRARQLVKTYYPTPKGRSHNKRKKSQVWRLHWRLPVQLAHVSGIEFKQTGKIEADQGPVTLWKSFLKFRHHIHVHMPCCIQLTTMSTNADTRAKFNSMSRYSQLENTLQHVQFLLTASNVNWTKAFPASAELDLKITA